MKRISQNKFASSLFSCLGVAACVAFSSCGKKDNDQFKNSNEFADFLKSKAQNEQVTFKSDDLTKFANDNWKTASKKTFQFTEAIKKQIAGEDSDNEDEEMTDPDQSNPEQQNPGPDQPKTGQANQEQPKTGTEHPKPTTTDPSETTTISDEKKLFDLISKENGQHAGVKIKGNCFDLNVFYDLYSWIYDKADNKTEGLVKPADLTWGNVTKIIKKSQFSNATSDDNEKKFGIKNDVSAKWKEENNIYTYNFTASSQTDDFKTLECPCYNGLLKFWAQANDLGFDENSFTDGKLKSSVHCGGSTQEEQKQKIDSVVDKLVEYLKEN